jgi:hypothetical protein
VSRQAELYRDFVVAPALERDDLLRLAAARTGARTVLYPGCSVHVTPSRHFGHVVYVDRSPAARAFFADPAAALDVARASTDACAGASLRFLEADFTGPLPFPDRSFDLLLALGAGGVTRSCWRYVRAGGFVLTDDHEGDALDAHGVSGLRLVAVFVRRGRTLGLEEPPGEGLLVPKLPAPGRLARGPRRAGRPAYVREAEAYLFERQRR